MELISPNLFFSPNSLRRIYSILTNDFWGLSWWLSSKEPCQFRRCGFSPQVRKITWRRKWQPTLVFLPGKSQRQRSHGRGGGGWCGGRLARRATVHGSHRRVGHDLATKQQLMISMGWVLREIQKKTHAWKLIIVTINFSQFFYWSSVLVTQVVLLSSPFCR